MSEALGKKQLSAEDRRLLELSEEEVRMSVADFSFEVAKMRSRINPKESWQTIVQAHLYLDHVVTATLNEALIRPDAIDTGRMAFAQKVDLIHAMGLMPTVMINAIKKVNKVRNSIAHKLDFEVADGVRDELRSVCPPYVAKTLEDALERKPPFSIDEYLRGFVVLADTHRQMNAAHRLMRRKAYLNAGNVLGVYDVEGA